jgi:hypothetical protein
MKDGVSGVWRILRKEELLVYTALRPKRSRQGEYIVRKGGNYIYIILAGKLRGKKPCGRT